MRQRPHRHGRWAGPRRPRLERRWVYPRPHGMTHHEGIELLLVVLVDLLHLVVVLRHRLDVVSKLDDHDLHLLDTVLRGVLEILNGLHIPPRQCSITTSTGVVFLYSPGLGRSSSPGAREDDEDSRPQPTPSRRSTFPPQSGEITSTRINIVGKTKTLLV